MTREEYYREESRTYQLRCQKLEEALYALQKEKSGEWLEGCPTVSDGELYKSWVCSNCGTRVFVRTNFCHHCGVRM